MSSTPGEVTSLLKELCQGNKEAEQCLIPLVYQELHDIAVRRMRNEAPGHVLQPTALVHEAYLRLVRLPEIDWQNRSHFYALAATIMRRILVDYARTQRAAKRGEGMISIALEEAKTPASERGAEILALDEALRRLAELDERQSKIVELRFFAGMSEEETAQVLGISSRTVKRDWRIAKAWLFAHLKA